MGFPSWLGHAWLYMSVYGSLAVGGMVFPGYDSGFQPSLAFFKIPWCVGMLISVLSFGILRWISKSEAEVVSRFIPKGLGIP